MAVEAMRQGAIGVRIEEGVGSTFWFTLPLATGEEPSTQLTAGLDADDGYAARGRANRSGGPP